jgi:1-deoxy-D-xylulose-5-phosphate synthase
MWDMAMLGVVPGLRLAAPRDEETLRDALRTAVDVDDAPTVIRYPKGALVEPVPAVDHLDGIDVLARHDGPADSPHVLLVGYGAMAQTALETAGLLAAHGLRVTVVDPRWVMPVAGALTKLVGDHDHVVTIEDGVVDGGLGAVLAQRAREAGISTPVQAVGIPREFLDHATREQLVAELRLSPADIARDTLAALAQSSHDPRHTGP